MVRSARGEARIQFSFASRGVLLAAGLALGPPGASAAPDPARAGALALAAEGRCEAALPGLRGLEAGEDVAVLSARAVCENAVGRADAALEAVLAARAAGGTDPDLDLQEGIARFQLGDAEGADRALARAEAGGAHPPERWLYQGLVALSLRRAETASAAFDAARRLDRDHVEPVASYYLGLAHTELGQADAARRALERVRDEWPGTPWAAEAERALAAAEPTGSGPWFWMELGGEYDDNAVLRGSDVRLPEEIPGQRDTRLSYRLQTGAPLWQEGPWTLGALAQLDGSVHDDLPEFDVTQPSVAVWLDRTLSPDTLARLELRSRYAWVESEPFQLAHSISLALHQRWSEHHVSTLSAGFSRRDDRFGDEDIPDGPGVVGARCLRPGDLVCGPPGVDESRARNRDGNGLWIGAAHRVDLHPSLALFGGYRFRRFSARGAEYSFAAHEWEAGVQLLLPASFDLELTGRYTRRDYRHPTTFPEPDEVFAGVQYGLRSTDRRERDLRTQLVLGRPLGRRFRVEARVSRERVRSTAGVFDYRRHQVGGYLIVALGSLGADS